MKAKVVRVVVQRAEGPGASSDFSPHTFHGANAIRVAEAHLHRISWNAPEADEGYDKVDFDILWENGQAYEGRFDLVKGGRNDSGETLRQQVRNFLEYASGAKRPAHIPSKEFQAIVNRDPQGAEVCRQIMAECEI